MKRIAVLVAAIAALAGCSTLTMGSSDDALDAGANEARERPFEEESRWSTLRQENP
ncbi:hypothetical protein [Lysobacter auxotrophicus]|uniref:Lipoprotein n=1 Tax=Lysobacter auxotrophicus TaxID=2992573 RepID=A0ABM8DHI9_9GAMM|nr:hypothetical protein [Lysobacter auxotrophicus]BDU18058.1 hypothetical protein LA521A_32590 [Lysobacter auxotrophicus]